MRFSCEKALLQNAVGAASRAVSQRSTIAAMEGILIEAGAKLRLTGYNMETGISSEVGAETVESGSVVLPSRLFGDIVRKLPDDAVDISCDERLMVTIKCGISEFKILGIPADDFPDLPDVESRNGIEVPAADLKTAISQTIFAVSDNESRPVHTGCLFDIEKSRMTVVAVDGYRLALRRVDISGFEGSGLSFVVPGNTLREVERLCPDSEENKVTICPGQRHVLFKMENTTVVCRLLEGDFLDYKKSVPRVGSIQLCVDRRDICSSIERVSLIISDRLKSPMRCRFSDGGVLFSASTALGSASDSCAVSGSCEDIEIGFNNLYLLEAFKAAPDERVKIELSTPVAPCIIVPEDGEPGDERFLYMVLPVRLRANESTG